MGGIDSRALSNLKDKIKILFEQLVIYCVNKDTGHSNIDFSNAYDSMLESAHKIFKEITTEEVYDIFVRIFVGKKGDIICKDKLITMPSALVDGEADDFAEEMIAFFKVLPLKYKITFSDPLFIGSSQIKRGGMVCNFTGSYLKINDERYYLTVEPSTNQQGLCFFYAGLCIDSHSLIFKEALSILKFFVQQGFYTGIYVKKKDEMKLFSELAKLAGAWQSPKKEIDIYSVHMTGEDNKIKYFNKEEVKLPSDVCYFLSKLEFDADNEKFNQEYMDKWLKQLSDLIKKSHNSKSREKVIVSASNWCFDSYVAQEDNITQSFLDVCFGLEALFSRNHGQEEISIMESISAKCSGLISQNISEANSIKKDIKKIYNTRSGIVHGRKLFLNHKERAMLDKARGFLERSIVREIEHLRRE